MAKTDDLRKPRGPAAVAAAVKETAEEAEAADTPQIRMLRMAVVVMSLILVVGFITVIARIIYLASRAPPPTTGAATVSQPRPASLAPEALLDLPADAAVRSLSLSGSRMAVHYTSPWGDGIAILDLETGKVVSRVRIAPQR